MGKTGVAIAVERRGKTAGAVRLAVIPRATTAVLISCVQHANRPEENTVFTDAWGSYTALGELFVFVLLRVARGQPLLYRQLVAEGTA